MPKKETEPRNLSMREAQDLDFEIGFLEGVRRRAPNDLETLKVLGDDYTRRGRFAEGLEVDQRLSTMRPEDPLVHYNLACSYALVAEPLRAVEALNRALDLGYRDFKWLRRDPDLRGLRKHPLFRQVRERIRVMELQVP